MVLDPLSPCHCSSLQRYKVKHPGYQLWKSMLTITLLGAKSLPSMDDNGLCDPYCKFKLGHQKCKSKVGPHEADTSFIFAVDLQAHNTGTNQDPQPRVEGTV